jgi:hypothetical protein
MASEAKSAASDALIMQASASGDWRRIELPDGHRSRP